MFDPICMFSSVTDIGTTMVLPVQQSVAARYIELHDIIPDDITSWEDTAVMDIVNELDADDIDAVQTALILLAHHRSKIAVALINNLEHNIEGEHMEQFFEMALAEALGWIGFSYFRDLDWEEPNIVPLSVSETTLH